MVNIINDEIKLYDYIAIKDLGNPNPFPNSNLISFSFYHSNKVKRSKIKILTSRNG